jgi:tryptophan synthase alpha chain
MRTIAQQVNIIQTTKKIGLMTHVVAGFPTLKETEEVVMAMEQGGADFVEIQIPFSDPLADGETIMRANDVALHNGVTLENVFQLVERLASKVKIPLLLMGYYNLLHHYGLEHFCRRAQMVGVQGLIIPDVPIDEEEYEHFIEFCKVTNLANIRVLSPTSTDDRIKMNMKIASGFVYCTAVAGTTGGNNIVNTATKELLKKVKSVTDLPIAIGFGISKPEHITSLIGLADIAVVGSTVIRLIEQKGVGAVECYIRSLVEPTITGTIQKRRTYGKS